MAPPSTTVTIDSEDGAWALLTTWLHNGAIPEVEFQGWPKLRIVLSGGDYRSSLNSGQMAALINFKMAVGRSYSAVAHGAYDMRRLREEEEEQLDFSTEVSKGSSIAETDLSPLVQAVASIVTTHPGSAMIVGAVLGLAFISKPIILKYFENRAKQIDADERARLVSFSLDANERAQHKVFDAAVKRLEKLHPQFTQALPDVQRSFWQLASASVNAEQLQVAGIRLSQEDLSLLSERRQKRPANVREIEQDFRVAGVRKVQGAYRVQLESPNLVITSSYRKPHFTQAGINSLMHCITSEISIKATLELKTVEGQVTGRLIRFAENARPRTAGAD